MLFTTISSVDKYLNGHCPSGSGPQKKQNTFFLFCWIYFWLILVTWIQLWDPKPTLNLQAMALTTNISLCQYLGEYLTSNLIWNLNFCWTLIQDPMLSPFPIPGFWLQNLTNSHHKHEHAWLQLVQCHLKSLGPWWQKQLSLVTIRK